MKEYSIVLPLRTNAGADYNLELLRWELEAERVAGGYTRGERSCGSWVDPVTRHKYKEPMQGYRVAATPDQWEHLLFLARDFFPDQIAFYWVEMGEVHLEPGRGA